MSLAEFYHNKVVVITGSGMGIGKEMAKQVLQYGGKVVLTGRNEARLKNTAEEFSAFRNNILLHVADVTHFDSHVAMVQKTLDHFGKLDVLIANAGLSSFGKVEELNPEVAKQIIDTNIYGSLYAAHAALPALKNSRGSLMFISSLAGLHGLPAYAPYSLSKMALRALAQSLRIEHKRDGIYVGINYVGFTENETDKKALAAKGNLIDIPNRPRWLTNNREKTARNILNQIKNKKHVEVQSILGVITETFSRLFPTLYTHIMRTAYKPD